MGGILTDWLKKKYGDKYWIHSINLIADILLFIFFAYYTWQVRTWMIECTCPKKCDKVTGECVKQVKMCVDPMYANLTEFDFNASEIKTIPD